MSILGAIKDELKGIGIPYEFMRWTSDVSYPYWIGEYSEVPSVTEDGFKETSFILTGTTNGNWLELENQKQKIERHFPSVCGLRLSTDEGAVAIFYDNSNPIDTGLAELKRIQVNLTVKEWRNMTW